MTQETECPEFDYDSYEPILQWADARVIYEDTFYYAKTKENIKDEKRAHWILLWKHGFIGWDALSKREDEKRARMASALFIYLWRKGVPAHLADSLAASYSMTVVIHDEAGDI